MKVLFLDFDGVITTPESDWEIIPEKVEMIKGFLDKTGAKVVISSSWRANSSDVQDTITKIKRNPYNPTHECPLEEYIIGVTPYENYSSRWNWVNPRGLEIQRYLLNHPEITNYVIIDDVDISPLENQEDHFVRTNCWDGITKEDIRKAIQIFKYDR